MPDQSPFGRLEGTVLVSACLLGVNCRYDGSSKVSRPVLEIPGIAIVPICPEQLGGLPTPRPSAQFTGGDGEAVMKGTARLIDARGRDVTAAFLVGAEQACLLAGKLRARFAILKERSPSCGTHVVWVEGRQCEGRGVAAAMLAGLGVSIVNEDGVRL